MHQATFRAAVLVVLPAATVLATGEANASGFATARFGGEHGNPITDNATAIYYNPAGLALSDGIHIFADGSLAFHGETYTHTPIRSCTATITTGCDTPEPPGEAGANNGKATLLNVLYAPMIGATAKFGDFGVGLGFYVPFGGQGKFDKNDAFANDKKYAGPIDSVARWYAIEGSIISAYLTLAVAYKLPVAGLNIGLSGNLIRSSIHTVRAKTADGSNSLDNEGRADLDVSGFQGSFGAGIMWEGIPKKLFIGASYQARPNISGGMTLKGTLNTNLSGGNPQPSPAQATQDLPDIIRLGMRYRPTENSEVRVFGDYTRWSSYKNNLISNVNADGSVDPNPVLLQARGWHDAGGVRVGGSYWIKPEVEAFLGLGLDSSAVPAETIEPALPDFTNMSVSAGARLEVTKKIHTALSYTQLIYFPRDVSGQSGYATAVGPAHQPDAGGRYTQWVGVINGAIDIGF